MSKSMNKNLDLMWTLELLLIHLEPHMYIDTIKSKLVETLRPIQEPTLRQYS